MDIKSFEEKLRSVLTGEALYGHEQLLSSIPPEKRGMFVQLIAGGYPLPEALQLQINGNLTERTVKDALQQKINDNTSEIQA